MKLFKLLLLLISINLNAQESRFKEGETVNVWAQSGLNMRDKPDAKAPKLTIIPYSAKVIVQPNIGVKIPFDVEEIKGFIVKGYWLLVKYGRTEGWVFDGFLSRLPAPVKNDSTTIEDYLDNQIGKVGDKYEVRFYDEAVDSVRNAKPKEKYNLDEREQVGFSQKYKHGIMLSYGSGEGGGGYTIDIPNTSIYEGYFLLKAFFFDKKNDILSYNKKEKLIKINPKEEGAGCYYDVKNLRNSIVIDGYCGC